MTELCYVDIGLGYQSVRLEFDTMCSSYSFLIRDEERCKSFISLITGSWFGYTVYDIVSLNQHWVGCFMSYRHIKVHVKECILKKKNDFIRCKIWRTMYMYVRCNWVGIQLNFTCVWYLVYIENKYKIVYYKKKALVCICPCILVTFSTHFA